MKVDRLVANELEGHQGHVGRVQRAKPNTDQKAKKVPVILLPNTRVHPRTMMVHSQDASVANRAVVVN